MTFFDCLAIESINKFIRTCKLWQVLRHWLRNSLPLRIFLLRNAFASPPWMNNWRAKCKSPEADLIMSLVTMTRSLHTFWYLEKLIQVTCESFSETKGRKRIRFLKEIHIKQDSLERVNNISYIHLFKNQTWKETLTFFSSDILEEKKFHKLAEN